MRIVAFFAIVAALLIIGSDATQVTRSQLPPGVIEFPVHKETPRIKLPRRAYADILIQRLNIQDYSLAINVRIGTPPQSLVLILDTGSANIVVNLYSSEICKTGACSRYGQFDRDRSSSIALLSHNFQISYVDGSTVTGDYVTDTIAFARQRLAGVTIGLAIQSDLPRGIFGLGYNLNQAGVFVHDEQVREPHNSIFDLLLERKSIKIKAFSLWQDDGKSGQILFGGVDLAKFKGDLITLPTINTRGKPIEFWITLSGMKSLDGTDSRKNNQKSTKVLVDSGAASSYFPYALVKQIWDMIDTKYIQGMDASGFATVDCALRKSKVSFNLVFGSATIPIPISTLVYPTPHGCELGVAPPPGRLPSNIGILGLNVLSSIYVVFDMTNHEISLAPTRKGASVSNIVEYSQYRNNQKNIKENKDQLKTSDSPIDSEDDMGEILASLPNAMLPSLLTFHSIRSLEQNIVAGSIGVTNPTDANELFTAAQNPLASPDSNSLFTNTNPIAFAENPTGAETTFKLHSFAGTDGWEGSMESNPGTSVGYGLSPGSTSPDRSAAAQNQAAPNPLSAADPAAGLTPPADPNQLFSAQNQPTTDHTTFLSSPPPATNDLVIPPDSGNVAFVAAAQDWQQGFSTEENLFTSSGWSSKRSPVFFKA